MGSYIYLCEETRLIVKSRPRRKEENKNNQHLNENDVPPNNNKWCMQNICSNPAKLVYREFAFARFLIIFNVYRGPCLLFPSSYLSSSLLQHSQLVTFFVSYHLLLNMFMILLLLYMCMSMNEGSV